MYVLVSGNWAISRLLHGQLIVKLPCWYESDSSSSRSSLPPCVEVDINCSVSSAVVFFEMSTVIETNLYSEHTPLCAGFFFGQQM